MAFVVRCAFLVVVWLSGIAFSSTTSDESQPDIFKSFPTIRIKNASEIFPPDYDKTAFPTPSDGKPMVIYFRFSLANIVEIDEARGFVVYQAYMSLYWKDERLVMPPLPPGSNASSVQLDTLIQQRLWVPDVMVYNLEEMTQLEMLGKLGMLRLLTSGYVQYGIYARLSVACHMDFSTYPFDTQHCSLKFGSCKCIYRYVRPISLYVR
ncbi:gamma-aminobutyric acid receptor subunit rho-1-like [Amphibalanus amphitrite]|uniref:gamma-aminobutyric acid receptor subunit rho-1-like n=1 Tax=Amphibalanus amphitrite TaxID=1232801 RepID=UPI001C92A388|nr:gamma-aminobutyric acid receptor subunit rho-1-like [Amphibalanus amphitrite]